MLLTVHGGPFTQYGWTLFDETQVYVSAGYAVVQCNPRGSSGYGSAHGRAIQGAWGELDAADVLAFLDAALEDPALDAGRVGIMGGSYGGYLTALLLGRTTRFAAAISERAFTDPVSFVGSSDIGWFFPDVYLGTEPERIAAQSPLASAGAITTPTLVIHSEEDWRCPWSRAPGSTSSSSGAASRRSCCCSRGRGTSCPGPGGRGTGWPGSSTSCGGGRAGCRRRRTPGRRAAELPASRSRTARRSRASRPAGNRSPCARPGWTEAGTVTPVLSRRALGRATLARQLLLDRETRPVAGALEHLVGLQAQVPLVPHLALWDRLAGYDPGELDGS